jgi:hypothetical protein
MRLPVTLLLLILALSVANAQERTGRVAERIAALRDQGSRFQPVRPLQYVAPDPATDALWQAACSQAQVFRLDPQATRVLLERAEATIALSIPTPAGDLILDLQRSTITTDDFVLTISDGRAMELPAGLHYRGIIRGDAGSLVAISVFEDHLMGMISDASGERILGPFAKGEKGLHVFYHEDHLRGRSTATCSAPEQPEGYPVEDLILAEGARTTRCVRFYWEAAYDIVQNKGSVANATNYLTGLFNQSAILYDNDDIDVTLSELFVWSSTSPYNATSSSGRLQQFGTVRTSFNGDLAHLLDLGGYGGVAWLNTLCQSTQYRMAYSGINSTYQNVPTYSWSVEVVTHEQGHNLGSSHTHACVWNGNNTAIDGCGQSAGYSEGSCPQGPLPTSSVGGTIMSYCHLTSSTIKFANGFGPQPKAVIINSVNGAGCLLFCGTSCDAPLVSVSVLPTSATITWTNVGAVSYDLQWKPGSSGTWTTVAGITGTSHQLTGLTEGTAYDYRVRSVCASATSAYTTTASFTTPIPCTDVYEPNNTTGGATIITLPATINALIGASGDNDYYRFTTDQVGTINVTLGNLPADYDVRLLNSGGTQLAISQAGGTSSESIVYSNAAAGTYYVYVYGWNGANNNLICYLLNVWLSGTQGCGTPTGATAGTITNTSALLSWNAMQGATSYDIQWRLQNAVNWTSVAGITGTSHTLSGLAAGTTYEFRVRANCTGGSSLFGSTVPFTTTSSPCSPGVELVVSLWLEGAYRSTNQLMVDNLRSLGLLPLTEPYTALGFSVTGSLSTTNTILNVTGNSAVVDWVLLELRDNTNPSLVIDTRVGLLRRNGTVTSPSGGSSINFCAFPGTYRIAVRHRNHLGCMTAGGYALSATPTTVDLRSSATATYGTNARKSVGSAMMLWPGNTNSDVQVKYTGTGNDRDVLVSALGGVVLTGTVQSYHPGDVNLDGLVKYTGSDNDRDVILSTIGGVIPTAVVTEQLP